MEFVLTNCRLVSWRWKDLIEEMKWDRVDVKNAHLSSWLSAELIDHTSLAIKYISIENCKGVSSLSLNNLSQRIKLEVFSLAK